MTTTFMPVRFDAPLVNPSPPGLVAATSWQDAGEGEPLRWLDGGVEINKFNYGAEESFGVWGAAWCAQEADLGPDDVKVGAGRPDNLDSFLALTTWASDECDLTAPSQAEVRVRAQQNFRLLEPVALEREFAARLLDDAGTPTAAADLVAAVGLLEDAFAETNTVGMIHARPGWAAVAAEAQLIVRSGAALKTPLGHTWVFGGGYVAGLADTLVATSPTFGWRGPVALRESDDPQHSRFYAIVERSLVVGYEALIGAVEIS